MSTTYTKYISAMVFIIEWWHNVDLRIHVSPYMRAVYWMLTDEDCKSAVCLSDKKIRCMKIELSSVPDRRPPLLTHISHMGDIGDPISKFIASKKNELTRIKRKTLKTPSTVALALSPKWMCRCTYHMFFHSLFFVFFVSRLWSLSRRVLISSFYVT